MEAIGAIAHDVESRQEKFIEKATKQLVKAGHVEEARPAQPWPSVLR